MKIISYYNVRLYVLFRIAHYFPSSISSFMTLILIAAGAHEKTKEKEPATPTPIANDSTAVSMASTSIIYLKQL